MNSGTGDDAGGLNAIFGGLHLGFLENRWWTNPNWGMAAMAMPAIWQLSGYVMALFLAGFRGIPGGAARSRRHGRREHLPALPPRDVPAAHPGRRCPP